MALMKATCKIQEKAKMPGFTRLWPRIPPPRRPSSAPLKGLHLHGGYGFTTEYEISKLARDAHIIDIYEGVREVQNMIIGREIV